MSQLTKLYRPGLVACFMGSLGSGKTLNMTYRAAILAARGHKVYANYPIAQNIGERICGIRHLVTLENALICLDEGQALLDSRAFSSNVNVTQWLLLIRKVGLGMFYTSQHFNFVDKRLREITDFVIVHRKSFGRRPASFIDTYRVDGFAGQHMGTSTLHHNPLLYSLYNSYDRNVALTLDGWAMPFDPDAMASGAAPASAQKRQR